MILAQNLLAKVKLLESKTDINFLLNKSLQIFISFELYQKPIKTS
jgi:hypothetical protein